MMLRVGIARTGLLAGALFAAGCGGGSSGSSGGSGATSSSPAAIAATAAASAMAQDPGAPIATGNTATDGFNWFNYRRQQLGLSMLSHNAFVDQAAQAHSVYQQKNNQITHQETPGKQGYTGASLSDRLTAAGYQFGRSYAYGEVISSSGSKSGVTAAEDLIKAIYHRFVIFEPVFRQAGAGAATSSSGTTYFTVDFVTDSLSNSLGRGNLVVYPFANQRGVPVNFFSNYESPDPVPDRNEVGYPISVHADIDADVIVNAFTVQRRGGAVLQVRLLSSATDSHTSHSAAAIVPLAPLAHGATYDVTFTGTVDGIPASRAWSFTTE